MITREEYLKALDVVEAYNRQLRQGGVMPSLADFKERRVSLKLRMKDVADKTGVSIATISRLENGNEVEYSTVKRIHDYYVANGA